MTSKYLEKKIRKKRGEKGSVIHRNIKEEKHQNKTGTKLDRAERGCEPAAKRMFRTRNVLDSVTRTEEKQQKKGNLGHRSVPGNGSSLSTLCLEGSP